MKILGKWTVVVLSLILLTCKGPKDQKEENTPQRTNAEKEITSKKTLLFFGTSLTAGLGLELEEAYPALIQHRIDSLGYDYQVINAGLSGDTSASALNRIGWVFTPDTDVLVLEMGANDGLRGIPIEETERNLHAIIDTAKAQNPKVRIILAGMQMPPNMGPEYTSAFKNLFPELSQKNALFLIPFLLDGVGGVPELNQPDGIHPTAEGQQILAENTWQILVKVLNQEK